MSDGRRARALVAEDTPSALKILVAHLKELGLDVVAVENGKLALSAALADPASFDVVLTDIEMPEMNGFELLEHLKAEPMTRDLPVLVISALDDTDSVARGIKLGAEDHLPKPFDEVILRARVTAVLERKRLRDREKDYLQRVERVIDAARAAESGNYESAQLADVGRESDELGRLARVLDSMVLSAKEREDRLQSRLESLQEEVRATRVGSPRGDGRTGAAAAFASGALFADRYLIKRELGRGGMGTVYKAHDRDLNEDVAIKTVHPDLLRKDPSLVERLKSELRLARSIAHVNVVRSYDFGQAGDVCYLTMEYVEGVTLRDLIARQGKLGVPATLAAGTQLADALDVAHGCGVIHRDIKPHNMLLDDKGVLKVMDFGIARPVQTGKRATDAGMVMGTPAYMAPEQLFGQDLDPRADLYAAGVVLYQCLTGELPHTSDNVFSLAVKIVDEDPAPPRKLNKGVPPALSALVMKLLAKERDDRTATAAELAKQLRQMH